MTDPNAPRPSASRPLLTHPRPRRYGWMWVVVALLLILGCAWFFWHRHHAEQMQAMQANVPPGTGPFGPGGGGRAGAAGGAGRAGRFGPMALGPLPVGTATVSVADVPVLLDGLGTVVPRANVIVHTRVPGQLMRVLYTEGALVKLGQVLAIVDPRPYQAALLQAQGTLMRDQALLADAKLDLQRYKTLASQDSIAKQQYDTQVALVQQDEGIVKSDQGAVDSAQVNLDYTRITAPVAGRVGLRPVDVGNVVQTTDTNGVATITEQQPIDATFNIPQDDLPSVAAPLRAGTVVPVEAYDRASKNKLASGYLLTVDNQIDVTTGTVKLKATFANRDEVLFPNQFVNIQMLVKTLKGALTVPTSAVQRGAQGLYAFVVKPDDTVTVRPITTLVSNGDTVAIGSGLAAGEVVVVDGADKLREGLKVEPVDRSHPQSVTDAVAPMAQQGGAHRHRERGARSSGDASESASSAR